MDPTELPERVKLGSQVVSADGVSLGRVKGLNHDRLQVDATMQPDYWLPLNLVGAVNGEAALLSIGVDAIGEYKLKAGSRSRRGRGEPRVRPPELE